MCFSIGLLEGCPMFIVSIVSLTSFFNYVMMNIVLESCRNPSSILMAITPSPSHLPATS